MLKNVYDLALLALSDFAFPKPLVQPACHDHAGKGELDSTAGEASSSNTSSGNEEGSDVAHGVAPSGSGLGLLALGLGVQQNQLVSQIEGGLRGLTRR